MAVQLFKKETGEIGTFDESSFLHMLDAGWCYTKEECFAEKETDSPEVEKETETGEEEQTETEVLTFSEQKRGYIRVQSPEEKELREKAKSLGISHWHVKNVAKLTQEIKDMEDGRA